MDNNSVILNRSAILILKNQPFVVDFLKKYNVTASDTDGKIQIGKKLSTLLSENDTAANEFEKIISSKKAGFAWVGAVVSGVGSLFKSDTSQANLSLSIINASVKKQQQNTILIVVLVVIIIAAVIVWFKYFKKK